MVSDDAASYSVQMNHGKWVVSGAIGLALWSFAGGANAAPEGASFCNVNDLLNLGSRLLRGYQAATGGEPSSEGLTLGQRKKAIGDVASFVFSLATGSKESRPIRDDILASGKIALTLAFTRAVSSGSGKFLSEKDKVLEEIRAALAGNTPSAQASEASDAACRNAAQVIYDGVVRLAKSAAEPIASEGQRGLRDVGDSILEALARYSAESHRREEKTSPVRETVVSQTEGSKPQTDTTSESTSALSPDPLKGVSELLSAVSGRTVDLGSLASLLGQVKARTGNVGEQVPKTNDTPPTPEVKPTPVAEVLPEAPITLAEEIPRPQASPPVAKGKVARALRTVFEKESGTPRLNRLFDQASGAAVDAMMKLAEATDPMGVKPEVVREISEALRSTIPVGADRHIAEQSADHAADVIFHTVLAGIQTPSDRLASGIEAAPAREALKLFAERAGISKTGTPPGGSGSRPIDWNGLIKLGGSLAETLLTPSKPTEDPGPK